MFANLIVSVYALGLLCIVVYVVVRGERARRRKPARDIRRGVDCDCHICSGGCN